MFVNGKIYKLKKVNNKIVNFSSQFCLGSISNKFDYVDAEEVSLKGNIYDFSVDYDAIDKSEYLYSCISLNNQQCITQLVLCMHLVLPSCLCLCTPPQLCLCCYIILPPLHLCCVHNPKSISFISSTIVHLIHFIDHSPSLSYLPYLDVLVLHCHSALL